jgi:hypothetical protein
MTKKKIKNVVIEYWILVFILDLEIWILDLGVKYYV